MDSLISLNMLYIFCLFVCLFAFGSLLIYLIIVFLLLSVNELVALDYFFW